MQPLTRRTWATLLAALPLIAQAPATPPKASSAADDVRKVSQQLAEIEIPMAIEPVFTFHV